MFDVNSKRLAGIILEECERSGHSFRTVMLELMVAHNEHFSPQRDVKPLTTLPFEPNVLKQHNYKLIRTALEKFNYNQRAAAHSLGMAKSTMHDFVRVNGLLPKKIKSDEQLLTLELK